MQTNVLCNCLAPLCVNPFWPWLLALRLEFIKQKQYRHSRWHTVFHSPIPVYYVFDLCLADGLLHN